MAPLPRAAAPVDLQVFLLSGLTNHRPFDAVYRGAGISNMLFALERYNGLAGLTERAIRPEYLEAARAFYEFRIDFPTFLAMTKGTCARFCALNSWKR